MHDEINLVTNYHLSLLGKILNYQLPTVVILLSYTIWFTGGVLFIIDLLALTVIIFTPYLIFVLKKRKS